MAYMNWSDAFVTGIEIVDIQHRGLVDLINRAAESLIQSESVSFENAKPLLDALVDYVGMHFSTEDGLMVTHGLDTRHQEHHHQAHADFASHVTEMLQQMQRDGVVDGHNLLRFLSNWLAFHILGEDQRMAREIKIILKGATPEEAFELTEGSKAEILRSANDVLVNSMVDLFAQLSDRNRQLAEKSARIEQAHAELDQYRLSLEAQVAERTRDLQKANAELEQARDAAESASLAKTRFLGTISHELLTPLNVIQGFANLIHSSPIAEKQRDQAWRILQSASHLTGLMQEVMYYARLDANEVNLQPERFLPASLLTSVADRWAAEARAKGLELRSGVDPALPALLGDCGHLMHALGALVSNAIKFTDRGGIALEAHLKERGEGRVRVEFVVRDSGIGIPLERQHELFKLFEQLDSSTTRRHGGLGLGLLVCARLAHLMGGELTFESRPGEGSVFRITLWLDVEAAGSAGTVGEDAPALTEDALLAEAAHLEQLLADDDMEARQQFARIESCLRARADAEPVSTLGSQIRDYDFSGALDTLRRIMRDSMAKP